MDPGPTFDKELEPDSTFERTKIRSDPTFKKCWIRSLLDFAILKLIINVKINLKDILILKEEFDFRVISIFRLDPDPNLFEDRIRNR